MLAGRKNQPQAPNIWLLQRHFSGSRLGSAQCWQAVPGRDAVLVLEEATETSAGKIIAQHLPGFIFLSVCPWERKSTAK